jgi:hypothetical protein
MATDTLDGYRRAIYEIAEGDRAHVGAPPRGD